MPSAWVFQKKEDVAKLGDKAAWYVAWYEAGRQKKKKIGSKSLANRFRQKKENDLIEGEISPQKIGWKEFRKEFSQFIVTRKRVSTQGVYGLSLDLFERIMGEIPIRNIDERHLDEFVAKRLEAGRRPATINRDLRVLRLFLRRAVKRKYRKDCPDFSFLPEVIDRDPTHIDDEAFAKLYAACDAATAPEPDPGAWWRAYLTFLYLTGWRMQEPLSVSRSDFDGSTGVVKLKAKNSKNGKPERLPLHPVIVAHLKDLGTDSEMILPWTHGRRRLYDEFHLIQDKAEVRLPDGSRPGFHDFRRGFATSNASRMTADSLQRVMRHSTYLTTQRYINMVKELDRSVENISVPSFLARKGGAS